MTNFKISEQELETILENALVTEKGCETLNKRGLPVKPPKGSILYRQLVLGSYGRTDLVRLILEPSVITIEVIELKVVEFNIAHLLQLGRYVTALKDFIAGAIIKTQKIQIKGYLIVNDFDDSNDYGYLNYLLNDTIEIYSMSFSLTGIRFQKRMPVDDYTKVELCRHDLSDLVNAKKIKGIYKQIYREHIGYAITDALEEPMDDLPF